MAVNRSFGHFSPILVRYIELVEIKQILHLKFRLLRRWACALGSTGDWASSSKIGSGG